MKYKLYEVLLDKDEILSHVFLECLGHEECEKIAAQVTDENREDFEVDIELKIAGKSVNPKKFFDVFANQYDRLLREEATKLVKEQLSEKFRDISNNLIEMEEVVDNWAENINWQIDNPLIKEIK